MCCCRCALHTQACTSGFSSCCCCAVLQCTCVELLLQGASRCGIECATALVDSGVGQCTPCQVPTSAGLVCPDNNTRSCGVSAATAPPHTQLLLGLRVTGVCAASAVATTHTPHHSTNRAVSLDLCAEADNGFTLTQTLSPLDKGVP